MSVRLLQIALACGDCLFGVVLLARYGRGMLAYQPWLLEQQVILLVVGCALPLALMSLRFPLVAGLAQFTTAFIGNQLLHEAPLPDLRLCSSISMAFALAILFAAVFRGILEITKEAFGESEEEDEKRATGTA